MKVNAKIVKRNIAGHVACFFKYRATDHGGVDCCFPLFCEVGQRYQSCFDYNPADFKTLEVDCAPWLITVKN